MSSYKDEHSENSGRAWTECCRGPGVCHPWALGEEETAVWKGSDSGGPEDLMCEGRWECRSGPRGQLKQTVQQQESFREPPTVLEMSMFRGQEWGFRLESRMRPELELGSRGVARKGEKMNFQWHSFMLRRPQGVFLCLPVFWPHSASRVSMAGEGLNTEHTIEPVDKGPFNQVA